MKRILTLINFTFILFSIISCDREPWGPLLSHRINTRNPKYRIELKRWDSPFGFGSGTSRLYVYKSGSKRKVAELEGGGRFSEVYWKDKDHLVVIDLEWARSGEQHGVREFKYGNLTITNICYIYNEGSMIRGTSDSLSLENGLLMFYNTELDRHYQSLISVPIDQFILTYEINDNTVQFGTFIDKPTMPISDYKVAHVLYKIELSDSNIVKLKHYMSQKME